MILEYIASGLSYAFTSARLELLADGRMIKNCNHMIDELEKHFVDQKFGILFNGFTEKADGPFHQQLVPGRTVQVDSGGLQMLTLGGSITEEGKDEVYKTQAKYGTVGMSFDVMPLVVKTGRSSFLDPTTRLFDPTLLKSAATATGKNLARQIEVFVEQDTSCRPMMIIQGDGIDNYQRWADNCLKQVPQDMQKYICGVSSGSAALGPGPREDVERIFTLSVLEVPDSMKTHFHLLGFGSPNRVLPITKMTHLFDPATKVSYDSTKHTGGLVRGQIQHETSIVMMGRNKGLIYHRLWKMTNYVTTHMLNFPITEDLFHDSMLMTAEQWNVKYNKSHEYDRNITRFAILMASVYNHMHQVEKMVKVPTYVGKTQHKHLSVYNALAGIKTKEDFIKWKKEAGRFLKSKRVRNVNEVSCLSNFFED